MYTTGVNDLGYREMSKFRFSSVKQLFDNFDAWKSKIYTNF